MYQLLDDVNVTFKTGGLEIWVEFYDMLEFWTSAPELEGQQDMFEEYTFKEIKSEIFENCEDRGWDFVVAIFLQRDIKAVSVLPTK